MWFGFLAGIQSAKKEEENFTNKWDYGNAQMLEIKFRTQTTIDPNLSLTKKTQISFKSNSYKKILLRCLLRMLYNSNLWIISLEIESSIYRLECQQKWTKS